MVPCQPSPARSPVASWACSASSSVSGRASSMVARRVAGHLGVEVVGGVPAGHVGHVDPPAVQVEGWPQPAPGDRVGARQQPAAQLGRVRSGTWAGWSGPASSRRCCPGGRGSRRTPAPASRRPPAPGGTRGGCRRSGWWSGRRAGASPGRGPPGRGGPGPCRRRAAGRPPRSWRRCSGGWTRPGRTASGRGRRRRAPARWSRCSVTPSRSPPYSCRPPSPGGTTGSSQARGPGPGRQRPPVRARRAGEAVGEDLVDDRVAGPGGRRRGAGEPEVAGVGDVVGVDAGAVEPPVAPRAAVRAGTGSRSAGCGP